MEPYLIKENWPPNDLAEYYRSAGFLSRLKTVQNRLQRQYPNADAETIVFDAATDLLMKEIASQQIYVVFMVKFDTENDFFRYLYETCCRKVIDQGRSFQRRFRQLRDEDIVADTRLSAEDSVLQQEVSDRVAITVKFLEDTIISKLSKIDRLILKYKLEGKTYQEIGQLLDLGRSTVHRRYTMIIDKLQSSLK